MAVTDKYPVVVPRRRTVRGKLYEQYKIKAGRREDGSPWVEYRSTLAAAKERAAEIQLAQEKMGRGASTLSSQQLFEAAEAYRGLPAGVTLTAAVAFYCEQHAKTSVPTVEALYGELCVSQASKNLSPRSVSSTKHKLRPFVDDFGATRADRVSLSDIDEWLSANGFSSPVTRNGYRRYIFLLFSFAVKRGYIESNPVKNVETAKVPYREPEYIPVDVVRRLLEKAQLDENADKIVPRLAIGLFAGVRTSELDNIDWRNVDLDAHCLRVVKTKRVSMPRVVDIESNLVEWLMPYRQAEGPIGVKELAFHRWRRKACEVLGITWTDNAMRHSFATYHVARYEDAPRTAFQMGHMNDVKMLYHHYRGLASKKDGEKFFSIKPNEEIAAISFQARACA